MKKVLTIGLAFMAPVGVAVGLIYKIVQDEIADPLFFVLLVIVLSTIVAAVKQITAVLPPDKVKVSFQEGARARHWEQASSWDRERSRMITSLYIPLRIENHNPDKDVILYDVEVRDMTRQILLNPPGQAEIKVGEAW